MIYIEKDEKTPLPKKYHATNNLCAIIYDQLTEIVTLPNYKSLLTTSVPRNKEFQALVSDLDNGSLHVLDYLEKNKLDKELTEILTKHITLSILTDFINYMYESLSCAKRGKMTVAYSLLRKPLTDELLIFEQILFDKEDFIKRFYHIGDPAGYDPSKNHIDKLKIINNAFSKLSQKLLISSELVHQLRYDKSSPSGINGISNKALHIVTRDKNYQTKRQNLNFVFFNKESHLTHWQHYYYFVPYLLMYSVGVIDEIIFEFMPDQKSKDLRDFRIFKRFIGFLIWSEKSKTTSVKVNNALIKKLQSVLTFNCSKCKHANKLERSDLVLFFETQLLLCSNCMTPLLSSTASFEPIRNFIKLI